MDAGLLYEDQGGQRAERTRQDELPGAGQGAHGQDEQGGDLGGAVHVAAAGGHDVSRHHQRTRRREKERAGRRLAAAVQVSGQAANEPEEQERAHAGEARSALTLATRPLPLHAHGQPRQRGHTEAQRRLHNAVRGEAQALGLRRRVPGS